MTNKTKNKILSSATELDTKHILDFVNSNIESTRLMLQYYVDNNGSYAYQKEFMYRILFDLGLSEYHFSVKNTDVLYNTEDINKLRLLTRGNDNEGYNCFFQEKPSIPFIAPEAKVIKASKMNCGLSHWLVPAYKKTYVITKNMKSDFGKLKSPYDPTSGSLLIPLIMRNINTFLIDKTANVVQFEYDSVLYTLEVPLNAHAVKVKLLNNSYIILFFDPCNMTKEELNIMFNYAQNIYKSITHYPDMYNSTASFASKYICKYAFENAKESMRTIMLDGITKDIQEKFPNIDIFSVKVKYYQSISDYALNKIEDLNIDYFDFTSHSLDDWNTKGYTYHEIQD